MKKLAFSLLALGAVLLPAFTLAQSDLSHYRNKNRLLLVFAPSKGDPRWQKQNALLNQSAGEFKERDLLRFDYFATEYAKSENMGTALRTRYGIKPGQFRVLLIGKDGHVASGSPTPLGLHELTEQIDRMPMRREEVRRRHRPG